MASIRKLLSLSVGTLLALQAVTASAAFNAYISVKGQKQGQFKGNSRRDASSNVVVKFTHGPTSPADFNRRTAAGERIHEPLVVTLKLDDSTRPQWVTAQGGGEVLSSVVLSMFRPASKSSPAVVETITLTNALIEKLDIVNPPGADEVLAEATDAAVKPTYLRVQLIFQKITITNVAGSTTTSDDWLVPGA
jgi:type VI secretion system Hcp family effector